MRRTLLRADSQLGLAGGRRSGRVERRRAPFRPATSGVSALSSIVANGRQVMRAPVLSAARVKENYFSLAFIANPITTPPGESKTIQSH